MFYLKQCLVTLTIAASRVLAQDNLDLILYENPDSCGGLAAIVTTQPFPPAATSQSNDFCDIQITDTYVIPVYILSNPDSSVGGIKAFRDSSSKQDMETPAKYVEAELAFSSDTHHYNISNDKFKTLADPMPKDAIGREQYFRKHADKVVERTGNVPSVKAEFIN